MGILDDAIREHLELKRRRGATDDEVARQEAEALGPARRQPVGDPAAEAEVGALDELGADASMPPPDLSTAAGASDDGPPPPPPPEAFEPLEPLEPLEVDPGDRLPPHGDVELDDEPMPAAPDEPVALDEPIHAEPSAEDALAPPPEPERRLEPEPDPDFPATEIMAADEPASVAEPADPQPVRAEPDLAGPEEPDLTGREPGLDEPPPRAIDDEATQARPLPPLDDDALPPEPALPDPDPEPEPRASEPPPPGPPSGDSDDVLEETPDFLQDTPEHDRLWFEQRPPRDFDFDE